MTVDELLLQPLLELHHAVDGYGELLSVQTPESRLEQTRVTAKEMYDQFANDLARLGADFEYVRADPPYTRINAIDMVLPR